MVSKASLSLFDLTSQTKAWIIHLTLLNSLLIFRQWIILFIELLWSSRVKKSVHEIISLTVWCGSAIIYSRSCIQFPVFLMIERNGWPNLQSHLNNDAILKIELLSWVRSYLFTNKVFFISPFKEIMSQWSDLIIWN